MVRSVDLAKELHEYTKVIGSHNKHIQSVASELVSNLEPELNPNQLIVLEWLKKYKNNPIGGMYLLHNSASNGTYFDSVPVEIYRSLDKKQEFQLLAAFADWGLSR